MASKGTNKEKIFLKVLWGDAELGSCSRKFSSIRTITAGRGLFVDLRSKIWPLHEDLTIIEKESGRIFLNSSIPWHGMISHGDSIQVLDPRKRKRRNFEIKRNS
ncbi:MAG: hypothetical protein NT027_17710, partial [Proteobacteria bacterium]|nr:hypothetical protein [Pseudomonadota bacterium]